MTPKATRNHRRTGRCGILAIAPWAAWFWAVQGRLLTKKKEERKGQKGRFNIFAMAGLRIQSTPARNPKLRGHFCKLCTYDPMSPSGATPAHRRGNTPIFKGLFFFVCLFV